MAANKTVDRADTRGDRRSAAQQDRQSATPKAYVALGGSAGSLEALQTFFTAMGADCGMAFIVVSHLAPDHDSQLSQLLTSVTDMPVSVVADTVSARADHVYVIPPNRHLDIRDGTLHAVAMEPRHGIPTTIYRFFRALAVDQGPRAIGILLSGSGSDGAEGIRAIKAHGGLTLVQTPESARFQSMPRSAIETGMADDVLPVEDMPARLRGYSGHAYVNGDGPLAAGAASDDTPPKTLHAILATVQRRHRHDFSHYKNGTVSRRIERRMGVCQAPTLKAYLEILDDNPEETDRLFADLLIGVTGFFRDPKAFKALEKTVLPVLVDADNGPDPIRIWVPGCATGEEAYSVAIVVLEAIQAAGSRQRLQVFATDIDTRALERARAGVYPETIAEDVAPERLARWFTRLDDGFRIHKSIRDATVFAAQNLISDPPFSRIDMICCRNLLIYLDHAIQPRIIGRFHYALAPGGYLFLGNAEHLGDRQSLFAPISRKWRLFRREPGNTGELAGFDLIAPSPAMGERSAAPPSGSAPAPARRRIADAAQRALLSHYAPASVVVSAQFETLYMHGPVGDFLDFPPGAPTTHLLTLARYGLRDTLRAVVKTVFGAGPVEIRKGARVRREGEYRRVEVVARRLAPAGNDQPCALISLRAMDEEPDTPAPPAPAAASIQAGNADLVAQLEHELHSAQEQLRESREQMEGANEELQTANEEALSMNEELQSSNEELESSKEELQSLNEELNTLNAELQENVDAVERANNDLANLLDSTHIATIFLDRHARIKRFSPAATTLFNLIEADVGRPIDDISHRIDARLDLAADVAHILGELAPVEREQATSDGRWFVRHMHPYRTVDDRIDGVVLTFTDITEIKATEQTLRATRERLRRLYDDSPLMYLRLDIDGGIVSINRFGAEQLGYDNASIAGHAFTELHPDEHELIAKLARCGEHPGETQTWESQLKRRDGTLMWVRANARQVEDADGTASILLACDDISEQKRLGEEVHFHATHDALTGLINRREFERLLEQAVATAQRRGEPHTLCYIDLDNFKVVNDSHGHHAGDEVLRQVADRMRQIIREEDRIGRLGGDEFALLLRDCAPDAAEQIARSLIQAIAEHDFLWQGHRLHIGCCIGVVAIGAATGDTATALRAADAACFAAKDAGPGTLRVYTDDDRDLLRRQKEMNWANRLRAAIDDDRMELFAQPIVTCADGGVRGFETLMRMRGPNNALIEPAQFIRAAIRYGLIREIDLIALRKTLDFLVANADGLLPFDWISVNVSGASIAHPDGADVAVAMIRAAAVDPRRLCFEITETSVISNLSQAQHFIAELRALGCRFALDDFGVGLASFDYLRALPVDHIKIDGSFIRDMQSDDAVSAMVKAVNDIAHLMGKTTVAEHVETGDVVDAVQALGIDCGQGFHYARPAPLAQVLLAP